jgi:heat shock protein HspQ
LRGTAGVPGRHRQNRRLALEPRAKSNYFYAMERMRSAKFKIGQVVKHRLYPFRGVVFDIDPIFNNTEEWYAAIPAEVRPRKDQPFYHLFAENAETEYIAYVSEQNLLPDESGEPVRHPQVKETFERVKDGSYRQRDMRLN